MEMTVKILQTWLVLLAIAGSYQPVRAETVSRSVSLPVDVTHIYLNGENELHLTQGDDQFVRVTAQQDTLARIQARIKGKALYLGIQEKYRDSVWPLTNSGPVYRVRFDVQLAQIDAIRVRGSGKAIIGDMVSNRLKVILYGNASAEIQSLKTRSLRLELSGKCAVLGGTITAEQGKLQVAGSGKINVGHMVMNKLDINIAGTADIELADLNATGLETVINGQGNLKLGGHIGHQYLEVNGSGNFQASKLISDDADIEIRGAGDVVVSARKQLTAEITRGANLVYYGSSKLETDINGSGKFRNAGNIPLE